jgi:hypothetical protein
MEPRAVQEVIAADLRQQQWLRLAGPPSRVPPGEPPLLGSDRVADRAFLVYRSCLFESVARGETFDLAPNELRLKFDEKECRLRLRDPDRARKELAEFWERIRRRVEACWHELPGPTPSGVVEVDPVILDQLTTSLDRFLMEWPEVRLGDVEALSRKAAELCLGEIGRVLLATLLGHDQVWVVHLSWLGELLWRGKGGPDPREVELQRPSYELLQHAHIARSRRERRERRQSPNTHR